MVKRYKVDFAGIEPDEVEVVADSQGEAEIKAAEVWHKLHSPEIIKIVKIGPGEPCIRPELDPVAKLM